MNVLCLFGIIPLAGAAGDIVGKIMTRSIYEDIHRMEEVRLQVEKDNRQFVRDLQAMKEREREAFERAKQRALANQRKQITG